MTRSRKQFDAADNRERPYLAPFLSVLADELYKKKKIKFEMIFDDENVLITGGQVSPEAD